MKRFLSILLIVLLLIVLCACGKVSGSASEERLAKNSFVVYQDQKYLYLVNQDNRAFQLGSDGARLDNVAYVDFTQETIIYEDQPQLTNWEGENRYSLVLCNREGTLKTITGAAFAHCASGDTVLYLSDYISGAATLSRYAGGKAEVLGEQVLADGLSLSPDGQSFTYTEGEPWTANFNGYYRVKDGPPILLGERCIPFAIADDGAFVYYAKFNPDYRGEHGADRGYTLFVRSVHGDVQLVEEMDNYDYAHMNVLFNQNLSEVMICNGAPDSAAAPTYISSDGGPAQYITEDFLSQSWPIHIGYLTTLSDIGYYNSDSDRRIFVSSIKSFAEGIYRDTNYHDYHYYYLSKEDGWKLEPFLPDADGVCFSSNEVVYSQEYSLYRAKVAADAERNAKRLIHIDDMSVSDPLVSEDGSIIYFRSGKELWSLKSGGSKPSVVIDDVHGFGIIPGTASCLIHSNFYYGDKGDLSLANRFYGETWFSKNGDQAKQIDECRRADYFVMDAGRAFVLCKPGDGTYDAYIVDTDGNTRKLAASVGRLQPLVETIYDVS